MRLVAVSIVKNEADVVEAFVRHTAAWVDHHLICDHASTDGTREIIGELVREGLSISLFVDDVLDNLQRERSERLSRLAVEEHGAEWVLPLDADEALVGPNGIDGLRTTLKAVAVDRPASLRLWNYYATTADDESQPNALLRIQHCSRIPSATQKVFISRSLIEAEGVKIGKGSHQAFRHGEPIVAQPLPDSFYLAHVALRSVEQQVLRLVQAQLQKLSRGEAHRFLDIHYNLGYEQLARDPAGFSQAFLQDPDCCFLQPIPYKGSELSVSPLIPVGQRLGKALLPYLQELALSHGKLRDATSGQSEEQATMRMRLLAKDEIPVLTVERKGDAFMGFDVVSGLADNEGPVPEAFLPKFRWGIAPVTRLQVAESSPQARHLRLGMLTYCQEQTVDVIWGGQRVLQHQFTRPNHEVNLECELPAESDALVLEINYSNDLVTPQDPRRLAVIFTKIQITSA